MSRSRGWIGHVPSMRYQGSSLGVEMSGRPKSRSDVRRLRNVRSPNGREPQGDGDPIVVRVRESRIHGEGGQVIRCRDAWRYATCRTPKRRSPSSVITGEPCAAKVASTVRGGAHGKGPQGTSPGAYPTGGCVGVVGPKRAKSSQQDTKSLHAHAP